MRNSWRAAKAATRYSGYRGARMSHPPIFMDMQPKDSPRSSLGQPEASCKAFGVLFVTAIVVLYLLRIFG